MIDEKMLMCLTLLLLATIYGVAALVERLKYRHASFPLWPAAVAVPLLVTWLLLCIFWSGIHYSDGTRVGFVTKLSKKGLAFLTWEGEMQQGGLSPDAGGSVSTNVWAFSVTSDEVASQLRAAMHDGKRLELRYVEYFGRGISLGSTSYDVVEVVR